MSAWLWNTLPTLPCSMKKVLGLNLLGSNPSSSSHTSFNWAWLPCGEEQQELVTNEFESHYIGSDSAMGPARTTIPGNPWSSFI